MKKTVFAAFAAAAALSAVAAEYKIDSHHANARFAIDHFGTSTNVGGFYGLEGKVMFDRAQKSGSIDLSIPVNKLQTGSRHFTEHLLSADLFNAEKFPEMRFVSDRFVFDKKGALKAVHGKLTLLGQTRPLTLTAQKFNCYQSMMLNTEVCGGDFFATIDRTQWGMNYLVEHKMSKNVRLDIQIEAAKQ